jgi:hypothetical protein
VKSGATIYIYSSVIVMKVCCRVITCNMMKDAVHRVCASVQVQQDVKVL